MIIIPEASPPHSLKAIRQSYTSLLFTWTLPTPLGDTSGYIIYYSDLLSDNESCFNGWNETSVAGGSTSSQNLTGLPSSVSLRLCITATSQHFFSDCVCLCKYHNNMWIYMYKNNGARVCVCVCGGGGGGGGLEVLSWP